MRFGYDVLEEAAPGGTPFGDLGATRVDVSTSPLDAGGASATQAFARGWGAQDLLPSSRAGWLEPLGTVPRDAGVDAAGSAITTAQPCVLRGSEQVVSGFDAPTAALEARGPGSPTLSWTDTEGNPSPGAIEFGNATAGGGELYYPGTLGDLRGRVMSLNVRVEAGSGTRVRLFLESGAQRQRARAPFRTPPLAQWDCAQIDPEAPALVDPGFDPADVVGAGLEIEASGEVRVYADQIAY